MKNREYFWTMKNGKKINVDDMTESHLRNVLKLIFRRIEEGKKNISNKTDFLECDNEPYCDDWMWK